MKKRSRIGAYRVFLISVLSLSLVISFGLHTIQVEHSHPGDHAHVAHSGSGDLVDIDEYLHGIEQKFFLALLSLIVFGAWAVNLFALKNSILALANLLTGSQSWMRKRSDVPQASASYVHYIIELFRRGILHPKVH